MPQLNFNLLNPSAELYSGPQVKLDPQAAYDTAQAQQQSNMLSQLYAKHYDPQTGGINYNSLIGEAAQNPLTARAIPKIMEGAQSQAQSLAEIEQKRNLGLQQAAAAEKSKAEARDIEIKRMAGDSYDRLQSVKTPEDFMAWHLANPELEGTNKAERTAKLQAQLAQPGGFEAALKGSTSSLQRILGIEAKTYAPTELEKLLALRKQYPVGTPERTALEDKIKLETTRAPAASTTVNLPPAPKAEQEEHGKELVSSYKDIKSSATTARNQRTSTDIMDKLLQEGFKTGFGKEATAKAANVLTSLGVKDAEKYAANAQTFQAFVRQNVLDEQMKQKGVQTEGDAQRIQETSANLTNATEANKFLIAVRRAQQDRTIAQQTFWDNWWAKNKTYEGAEEAWNKGEGGKSIFELPALKKYATDVKKPTQSNW